MLPPAERPRLVEQLCMHEGVRLTLYLDTKKKWTIGVGYNVSDRGLGPLCVAIGRTVTIASLRTDGITREEALTLLSVDINTFEQEISRRFRDYNQFDAIRKRVILDFVFNVGTTTAAKFERAIDALSQVWKYKGYPRAQQALYAEAAFHLMDSLWSHQVGDGLGGSFDRADRLCRMLVTGKDYTR